MNKRFFQMIAGCAFALAGLFLWAGLGGLARMNGDTSATVATEWTPDLKALDLTGDPIPANASFPETLARPLFSPTRTPPEPRSPDPVVAQPPESVAPPPSPEMPTPSPDGLVLKGIFIDEGRRVALIQTPAAPQGVWLASGAQVEGWTVRRIDEQSIALEANGQVQKLALYMNDRAD